MKLSKAGEALGPQPCDEGRRSIFRWVAAVAGFGLLPQVVRSAVSWEAAVPAVRVLRADEDGRLTVVRAAEGMSGTCRIRVCGAASSLPFALEAHYGDRNTHRFWHAWREPDGVMAQSHHAAVTCHAQSDGLRMSVRSGTKKVPVTIPAESGRYVLAIDTAGRGAMSIASYRLREPGGDCREYALACRSTQAAAGFSYVVLTVELLAA